VREREGVSTRERPQCAREEQKGEKRQGARGEFAAVNSSEIAVKQQ